MTPILVEDSTSTMLPAHVEKLVEGMMSQLEYEVSESDLTVAILFVLLMETGFTPLDPADEYNDNEPVYGHEFNIKRLQQNDTLPPGWRIDCGATYVIRFRLEPFPAYDCTFLAITNENNMVDNLIVNLLVPQLESNGRCLCIHPSKYILRNNPQIPSKFQNLKELSMIFKNAVSQPIRCDILQKNNLMNASLMGMPEELKLQILMSLSVKDLGALASTSKDLLAYAEEQTLWRRFVQRDFGTDAMKLDTRVTVDWKLEYKNRLAAQLKMWNERERQRQVRIRGQFLDHDDDEEMFPTFSSNEMFLQNPSHYGHNDKAVT